MAMAGVCSPLFADSGGPVEKKTYSSANREYFLEVDPRWNWSYEVSKPLLTFRRKARVLWRRTESSFKDFRYPLDVKISDDGKWLVFGGVSVHNISFDLKYDEGLRFYRADGSLVRFVSRRDLPAGDYGISTSHWYDETRTRIVGSRLQFFTPTRSEPLIFELSTGALVRGRLTPGQGDDSHQNEWLERLQQGARSRN
ncbi:MAG TPA: hypothetical protein VG477_08425 [Thermoanaerobaculia bacterium]|nr:hypothetical protein [Thermoanaerobaculia bacterium]